MGNNHIKDKDLKVCILLDNIVYNAGDVVSGRVCIRATANRPYKYLYINIIGSESVQMIEDDENYDPSYTQFRETYWEEFVLAKFNMGINIG